MKRFFALAALVLGLAACQTEPEGLDVNVGGEVDTTITVTLPDTETRANSVVGAFANLDLKNSDLTIRYILQVYYGETAAPKQFAYSDETHVTFDVRLVPGRDYKFVVWADVVDGKNAVDGVDVGDNHYDTENLTAITFKGDWNAMDETFDAFTGVFDTATKLTDGYTGTSSINIPLTRPFAKLRVLTTDMVELGNLGIVPEGVKVKYTVPVYNSFNALNGAVNNTTVVDKVFEYNLTDDDVEKYEATQTTKTLFTNYLFGAENGVIKFEMSVYDNTTAKELIKFNNFSTDIPVQRNYLTTIQGNVLTEGNDIKVTIDERFDGNIDFDVEEDTITTTVNINTSAELVAALQTAVAAGETNIVFDAKGANIGNFNKDDNTWFTTNLVPTGVTVTLRNATVSGISRWNNANGTLIFENCTFTNNSAYSINFGWGNGHVKFTNCKLYGWCSFSGVTVEMNDCNIAGNGSYALVRSYNTFTMNNCTIDGSNAIKDDDYPDGVSIGDGAVLTMTGCTMTDAEYDYGESLIDGKRVVDYGENSSYIIVDGKRLVCNPSSLEYALKNGNAILMENNITVEAHLTNTSHGTNINIDGGGNELTLRGIYGVSGANVSLSNMTLVDSKTDDYTIFNQGGKIELNNVTYNSTINKAFQMAGGGDVVLTDCNISGDVTGTYSASNIWCGDGRNVTVNGGTYGSIFMNAQYHSGWPAASAHAASKITLNDGTITKLILETELGAEGYYVSATLTQNGGTITNLVENPQNLDLTGRSQYNK